MDEVRERKIEQIIRRVRDLATLPAVLDRIVELTAKPDVKVGEIEKAISADPVIATKLLRLVNSAFFAFTKEITSIRQAIMVLGIESTKNLVYGTSIITTLGCSSNCPESFPLREFWKFSAACAYISSELAVALGYPFAQEAFLAGLTHGIGKIVLAIYAERQLESIILLARTRAVPLSAVEEELLGYTHAEAGSYLAKQWRLPQVLHDAIAFNENPSSAESNIELVCIVRLATVLCRRHGIGTSGEQISPPETTDEDAWKTLKRMSTTAANLDRTRLSFSIDRAADRAELFVASLFFD